MDEELLQQLVGLGSIDEELVNLLRKQVEAKGLSDDEQARIDATRERESGRMVGRVYVPDVAGSIGGIFERGAAAKRQKAHKGEIEAAEKASAEARAKRDQTVRDYMDVVLGRDVNEIPNVRTKIERVEGPAIQPVQPRPAPVIPPQQGPAPQPQPIPNAAPPVAAAPLARAPASVVARRPAATTPVPYPSMLDVNDPRMVDAIMTQMLRGGGPK